LTSQIHFFIYSTIYRIIKDAIWYADEVSDTTMMTIAVSAWEKATLLSIKSSFNLAIKFNGSQSILISKLAHQQISKFF